MAMAATFGTERVHPIGADLERRWTPVHSYANGAAMGLICRRQLLNELPPGAAAQAPGC
jgi:hypothetical protein